MTNIYLFNLDTGEYAMEIPYTGQEVPENGTLKEVPEVTTNQVAVFDTDEDEWQIKSDYRFTHKMIDKDNKIYDIEEIGEIPEGYILITIEQAEELEEQERIANLHITKLDFYTNLCLPASISYATLSEKISELGMQAQWDLCNHVYYGVIKPFLAQLPLGKTEEEIIAIFEELMQNSKDKLEENKS